MGKGCYCEDLIGKVRNLEGENSNLLLRLQILCVGLVCTNVFEEQTLPTSVSTRFCRSLSLPTVPSSGAADARQRMGKIHFKTCITPSLSLSLRSSWGFLQLQGSTRISRVPLEVYIEADSCTFFGIELSHIVTKQGTQFRRKVCLMPVYFTVTYVVANSKFT